MKIILLLFVATVLHAADRWYEIRIAGQPAGYQHSTFAILDGGLIRTTDESVIVLNRLGSKVETKTKAESVESATGELISVREETSQSQQVVVTEAELKGDRILLRSTAGANSYNRSMTLKAPVCGPTAFARLIHERLKTAGDQASCRLYTPSVGSPYKSTRTLLATEGAVLHVKTEVDGIPGSVTEVLDLEGFPFESEREMPFGKLVSRAVDRETALRAATGAELPGESFDRTMARSNVRFADARAVERIKLKIMHKKSELGWPAFRSPSQTVLEKTPSTVVLEVVRPEKKPSSEKIDDASFLRPNQILQSDDAEVVRLAHEIAGEERDRFKIARKLQDWVAANMTFDLGIAVAPASEVVRNRKGTCVAYSVLLASMARAMGIPSRLAGGYIYVSLVWGGHAWVEVLVDSQWLPLDAAGYRPGLADAARIQFDSYTARDSLAAFSVAGFQMYGNVEIQVLEYSVNGKTVRVPEAARQFQVSEDEYLSEGLGFALTKPAGFAFAQLNAVYPDPTIAQVQLGASKVTVSLLEAISNQELMIRQGIDLVAPGARGERALLDGRAGVLVSSPVKAKLLVPEGQSLWVLTAEGSDARGLLKEIAGGWKWFSTR